MQNPPLQIVVVEDDPEIRTMLVRLFEAENWSCAGANRGQELDRLMAAAMPQVVVLDLNLPGEDGLSIARRLSALKAPPAILMLTARSDDVDRIVGLEIGADDYLGKPFNPRELVARVRALMRRFARAASNDEAGVLECAGLVIDEHSRSVTRVDGEEIALSGAEFALLVQLARAKGRILSRDFLLDAIHGRSVMPFDRAIDVLVSRVRKKIDRPGEVSMIEGVRNAGYVLREQR
jgi:two-component system OmpR family response regulator